MTEVNSSEIVHQEPTSNFHCNGALSLPAILAQQQKVAVEGLRHAPLWQHFKIFNSNPHSRHFYNLPVPHIIHLTCVIFAWTVLAGNPKTLKVSPTLRAHATELQKTRAGPEDPPAVVVR